jgi:hypothetical protein
MSEERERALDDALGSGSTPSDEELAVLTARADALRQELQAPAPNAARERALFVQGVGARKSGFFPLRFLAPAAIVVAGIAAVAGFGRTALPGQTLYPVREALASVGLANTPEEEIDRRLTSAREQLREARTLGLADPAAAQTSVLGAIGDLERARTLTDELAREDRAARLTTIALLEERAVDMLVRMSEGPDPEDEIRGEDNSGPGSDNSGPGSDNSGPGSDNSGPGSGDDSGGDDSSGSGGGGDDDDSSGSGSGDDDSDDSSGSGSGDGDDSSGSGSGDDDSSGSGSGDGDDSSGSGSGDGDDSSGSGSGDRSGSGSGEDSDDSSGSGSGGDDSSGSGSGDRSGSSGFDLDDNSGSGGSGSGDDDPDGD